MGATRRSSIGEVFLHFVEAVSGAGGGPVGELGGGAEGVDTVEEGPVLEVVGDVNVVGAAGFCGEVDGELVLGDLHRVHEKARFGSIGDDDAGGGSVANGDGAIDDFDGKLFGRFGDGVA